MHCVQQSARSDAVLLCTSHGVAAVVQSLSFCNCKSMKSERLVAWCCVQPWRTSWLRDAGGAGRCLDEAVISHCNTFTYSIHGNEWLVPVRHDRRSLHFGYYADGLKALMQQLQLSGRQASSTSQMCLSTPKSLCIC